MPPLANNNLRLDPNVWGPHYWFFLHTVSLSYPHHPNAVTKKKYYDFFNNLPLFIPVESIGKSFEMLLDEYPVSPYLTNKESLIKWTHFIHNKINQQLEKPSITLNEFYFRYYEEYKPKDIKMKDYYKWREKIIYTLVIISTFGLIAYLYNK